MALFGALISHENCAVRACDATLVMQVPVKQHSVQQLRKRWCSPMQIRSDLNTQEVVVHTIGSDLHMSYILSICK
jgi:hypothetical protein